MQAPMWGGDGRSRDEIAVTTSPLRAAPWTPPRARPVPPQDRLKSIKKNFGDKVIGEVTGERPAPRQRPPGAGPQPPTPLTPPTPPRSPQSA